METRLEIRPVPTQKQRKQIKSLPQVVSVDVDGNEAFVTHSAYDYKEHEVINSLRALGFQVKTCFGWGGVEEAIKVQMRKHKKAKKERKRRK